MGGGDLFLATLYFLRRSRGAGSVDTMEYVVFKMLYCDVVSVWLVNMVVLSCLVKLLLGILLFLLMLMFCMRTSNALFIKVNA